MDGLEKQARKVKCPHCGWIRTVPVGSLEDLSETHVVRGFTENLKNVGAKIKAALGNTRLDEANAWMDMPPCPHCKNTYQYNVRTGERRP
jgi:phage FluMu protein Com